MDHNDHDMMDHGDHKGHGMINSTLSPLTPLTTHGHHNHDNHVMDNGVMSHDGHMNHNMDHMMKMYFHFSPNATILFSCWKTTSWETMLGSCIAVFIIAGLYEGLKVFREHLLQRASRAARYNSVPVATNNDDATVARVTKPSQMRMLSLAHAIQTLLHLVQIVVSYLLMLIFMTFNVWLCLAVALGATVGYFVFSWKRPIIIDFNEHCH